MCTRHSAPGPDHLPSTAAAVPRLTEGTEPVGEFEGSGYRTPPQLVQRFDGQVIQLPPLLYQAVLALKRQSARAAGRGPDAVLARTAEDLSSRTGREFAAEHVVFLLDQKLAPLGITTYSDGSPLAIAKANPFLGLRFRATVLSERATWFLSGLFSWLYHPVALVLCLTGFLIAELWVFAMESPGQAMTRVMADPTGVLIVALLTLASSAFHEMGHAAACRYGGVAPGHMGCGIYLVWPAFYTDVTNSYRLGRAGRIRTDLGGVYFNGLFVIGLVLVYLRTGSPVLLVAVLATNMEIVQQLLPTLRFDGYYIVADLVGIPDLFKYIGPILKRAFLRRPDHQRLDALKRWPQLVVTVWVLTVLPALAFQLGLVLSRMPELATTAWHTAVSLADEATADDSSVPAAVTSGLQILFLLLPLVGALLALWQLSGLVVRLVRRRRSHSGEQEQRASGGMRPRMPVSFLLGGLAVSTVLAVGGSTGQVKAPRTAASVRGSAPRDPRDDEYELIFEGLR